MSIGLDATVLLRLLTGEPAAQAAVAHDRLERAHRDGELVIVTDLALAEAYYALTHHYGFAKAEARSLLRRLARSGAVSLSPPEALAALDAAPGAGLVDRLIHARHTRGRLTTLTFDRKMSTLDGAVRLK